MFSSYLVEFKKLFSLAIPIFLAQLALTGLGVVDTIMSGQVGTEDLAAIGLGSSILLPVFMISTGVLLAMTPLVAKAFGENQHQKIGKILHQGMWLSIPLGVFSLLLLWNLDVLLDQLALEPQVYQLTEDYLTYIAIGLPAIAFYQALRFFWEGLGTTLPTMYISFFALVINIPLNAVFIYGWLGIPAYGAAGCGIASAIVMWLMLVVGLFYVKNSVTTRSLAALEQFIHSIQISQQDQWHQGKSILSLGIPNTLALLFEVGMFSFIALFIAKLGSTVIAAHQVAISFTSVAFMIPLSLAMAITVRVGQSYGQNDFQHLQLVSRSAIVLAIALGLIVSVITHYLKVPIAELYSHDAVVIDLAVVLISYAVIYQVFDAIQAASAGALRGLHSTKMIMVVTFISYWLIGLLGGYVMAFTDWFGEPKGVEGFWLGIIYGLVVAAVLLQIKLRWQLKKVQKEMENVAVS